VKSITDRIIFSCHADSVVFSHLCEVLIAVGRTLAVG